MEEIIETLRLKTEVKKGENYILANLSREVTNGPMQGWVCGHFYPKESIFHRHDIEICVKVLPVGKVEDLHYHLCSFEFLLVLSGKVEYEIDGDFHVLTPGTFYMLNPGNTERIVKVYEETTIIAVRLPSIPKNKIFVEKEKSEQKK